MIHRQRELQRLNQNPEITYDEACDMYRLYKSRTLKANTEDPEFGQNMKFREFFLSVKKRYDVRFRAQKFRIKKKKEIAQLKQAALGNGTQSGKRELEQIDNDDEDDLVQEMELKIQKLEAQV